MSTGYHRDLQLLKEEIFPGIEKLKDCLTMTTFMLKSIKVREDILQDAFYKHVFSVEVVNNLVLSGVPFRDAYKQVGLEIEADQFSPNQNQLKHTHEGSIGNLCTEELKRKMEKATNNFQFQLLDKSVVNLLK
jgi:argininosuccinate lyase